jgi:hypothetical protein
VAATKTLRLELSKDNTSRHMTNDGSGATDQGSGGEPHWIVGKAFGLGGGRTDVYRVHAQIDESGQYTNVGRVIGADLVLRGSATHIDQGGNISRLRMRPITPSADAWSEGNRGENSWGADEYLNERLTDASSASVVSQQLDPGVVNRIDIMPLLRFWAPTSVLFRIGGVDVAGRSHINRGFKVWSDDEDKSSHAFECCSIDHATSGNRPYVEVTYEPSTTKPVAVAIAPLGNVNDAPTFVVGMADEDPDQRISAYELEVRKVGGTALTWNQPKTAATAAERATGAQGQCSIVAPKSQFKIGQQQEWRARVWDSEPKPSYSDWTPWVDSRFTVTGGVPTLGTVSPIGTVDRMAGVRFMVPWTHPQGKAIASLRIQTRVSTVEGSPLWDGTDNAWDTGDVTPTATEQTSKTVNRGYTGDSLEAGNYSWRIMVTDVLGAQSAWAYGTYVLTADYDVENPGAGDNVGYSRKSVGFRIILRAMGTSRGPGALKAVIEDALNVGMSSYVSAPGECYFTLPATHPQVGECEPFKRHCSFEQYRNGKWQEIWAGILIDFDATGDDVVINGMDYIGLLSLDIERRSWKSGDANSKKPKYYNQTISSIIADQLDTAIGTTDSPVGFIERPPGGTASFQTLATKIVIDASYRQRLEFIRGLLDSYRAGTGVRSRLVVRRKQNSTSDETHGYSYAFNLLADSGTNRKALRLEWGGLVQGFRIQAFGDFAVRVLGIGREVNELKPHYATGNAPNMSTSTWGNLARVAVWQDIDDEADLQRRVDQLAAESARVGKRMALGLRVRGIAPFDGWDLTDSVPIDIVRGVVDTGNFAPDPSGETAGLSWWTIWGTEWRWYPDGHDELTLVVRPREDSNPPNPDLVVGKPFVPTPEWTMAPGAPNTATMAQLTLFYLDTDTNDTYEKVVDEATGVESYVLTAEGGGGGGGTPDTTPPGVITGLGIEGTVYLREDGTLVSGFDIDWVTPADTDVVGYDVELDSDPAFPAPQTRTPSAPPFHWEPVTPLAIVGISADPVPITYYVRVRAFDAAGNRLEWDDPTTPPPVASGTAPTDPWAPDEPESLTASPGYRLVSLSWPRVDFADLSRYGVRYTAAKAGVTPPEPDLDGWIDLSTLSTRIVITNLIPGAHYWFEVRAIDRSGQVRAYADPPTNLVPIAVYASQEPEAGWSERIEAIPEALAPDDVSPMEDVQDFLATGTFDADLIKTGTIRIDNDPHIEAFDPAGRLTARWDANGALYLDPANPNRAMWINEAEVKVSEAFTGDVGTTVWRVISSAEGISGSDINWGVIPGGHNLIPNAAFELVPFPTTVATVKTWTVAADWGASVAASDVNVTKTGADLTLTTATY